MNNFRSLFSRPVHAMGVFMARPLWRVAAFLPLMVLPLFAQVDTSSITNQANSFITLFLYIAAVACVAAFAFGIFKLFGRDIGTGIGWIIGAIVAGYIIGHAISWTSTITGVSVTGQ